MNDEHKKKLEGEKEGPFATPINTSNRLKEWIKRDFFYICLLLLAVFACLLTINHSLVIQKECNERWEAANVFSYPINNSYPNIDFIIPNMSNPNINIKS